MIAREGSLLLVQSSWGNRRLVLKRFYDLAHMDRNTEKVIWAPKGAGPGRQLWAPELLSGRRALVRLLLGQQRPDGQPPDVGAGVRRPLRPVRGARPRARPVHDVWAIDLTVVSHEHRLYAVWSGWEEADDGFPQNLYIFPMSDPWTISGERRCLSRPEHGWEMSAAAVNEGPEVVRHPGSGRLFLLFSADASWTQAYKMGLMEWTGGDVTDPTSWRKHVEPWFTGGGHGCLVDTPAGTFLVYHRKISGDPGWADREIRSTRVVWDSTGYPVVRQGEGPLAASIAGLAAVPGRA